MQDRRDTMRMRLPLTSASLFLFLAVLGAALPSLVLAWTETKMVSPRNQAENYAVQVERFEDAASAQALADSLRQKEFSPYILAARGSDDVIWYAVRLGLFDSIEDARAAADDYNAKFTGKAFVAISGNVDSLEKDNQVYFLQVGAFVEHTNALERVKEYKGKGYKPGIVKLYDKSKNHWYVVFTDVFENPEDARKAATAFHEKEKKPCYINMIDADLFKDRKEPAS